MVYPSCFMSSVPGSIKTLTRTSYFKLKEPTETPSETLQPVHSVSRYGCLMRLDRSLVYKHFLFALMSEPQAFPTWQLMRLVFSEEVWLLHTWTSSTTYRLRRTRFFSWDIINDSFIKSARSQTKQINHFIWERRRRDQNITGFDCTFEYGWDGKWNSITNTRFCDSITYRMFWSVPGEYISAQKKRERFTWFIRPECDFYAISDIGLFFMLMRAEWTNGSVFQLNHLLPFSQLRISEWKYTQSKY